MSRADAWGELTFDLDLGHDHWLKFTSWHPDNLKANRERYGVPLPNVKRAGGLVAHPNAKVPGERCLSGITFDLPELASMDADAVNPGRPKWQVQSWDPLTISPSLLCLVCGDHGFIREGKWVPA